MTKYFSTYKVRQKTSCCTILYSILYKTNNLSIAKIKTILLLAKPINKKISLYINAFDRKDLADINKKMPNKNEVTKIPEVKFKTLKSKYSLSFQSKLEIQSI